MKFFSTLLMVMLLAACSDVSEGTSIKLHKELVDGFETWGMSPERSVASIYAVHKVNPGCDHLVVSSYENGVLVKEFIGGDSAADCDSIDLAQSPAP